MDSILLNKSLPPGFRFHPTDEELFMFYLRRKVLGKSLNPQMMSEVDVYQFAPWELPAKACVKTKDLNWYFLCPCSKKYPNAGRSNRATVHGYWKSTGQDRTYIFKNRPLGKIKTLIFHRGKAPKGDRTDWVMYEYRLEDRTLLDKGVAVDSYVICKIFEKSGLGPKNCESYGAPFVEEEWDSDNDDYTPAMCDLEKSGIADRNAVSMATSTVDALSQNVSVITSTVVGQNSAGPSTPSSVLQSPCAAMAELPPIETEEDEIDRLLAIFAEGHSNRILGSKSLNGSEDLAGCSSSSEAVFDWSQFLSEGYHLEQLDPQD
ncbi:hypothetical protein RND81_04G043100 [Saponaria officinalis]|uniref:NAC domain-containing protein n=1 Tax=Saponaria officinalis TaxID=3572 RepID=A0AAW1LCR8_SAPOF